MKVIFYSLYKWAKKANYWDSPYYSALLFLSFFIFLNLLSLYVVCKIVLGDSPKLTGSKIIYVCLYAIINLIVYWLYVRNGRYHKIEKFYDKKDNLNKQRWNLIAIIYIVFSIVVFFGLGFYRII